MCRSGQTGWSQEPVLYSYESSNLSMCAKFFLESFFFSRFQNHKSENHRQHSPPKMRTATLSDICFGPLEKKYKHEFSLSQVRMSYFSGTSSTTCRDSVRDIFHFHTHLNFFFSTYGAPSFPRITNSSHPPTHHGHVRSHLCGHAPRGSHVHFQRRSRLRLCSGERQCS